MITQYGVYYKTIKIGVLEINKEGFHRYTPNFDGVEKASKFVSLGYDMKVQTGWGAPIPFFKNRIANALRFSREDVISSHTDDFIMKKEGG